MLGYALRLDNHVIHIYLDISSDLLFEDSVHSNRYVAPAFLRTNGMTL